MTEPIEVKMSTRNAIVLGWGIGIGLFLCSIVLGIAYAILGGL